MVIVFTQTTKTDLLTHGTERPQISGFHHPILDHYPTAQQLHQIIFLFNWAFSSPVHIRWLPRQTLASPLSLSAGPPDRSAVLQQQLASWELFLNRTKSHLYHHIDTSGKIGLVNLTRS